MKKFSSGYCFPMFFKHAKQNIAWIAVLILAGCTSALYKPTAEQVQSGTSLDELNNGREVYIGKCGGCHSLILPGKFNAKQWEFWTDSMQERAKVSNDEKILMLKYLKTGARH